MLKLVNKLDSKSSARKGLWVQVPPLAPMKYFFIILVIVVSVLEIAGDILFKEWSLQKKNIYLIIGTILYMGATIFWAFSLKYQNLSKAVVIFGVLTVIIGVLVGVFFYKEPLSLLNIIGVVFGLACIILLEI